MRATFLVLSVLSLGACNDSAEPIRESVQAGSAAVSPNAETAAKPSLTTFRQACLTQAVGQTPLHQEVGKLQAEAERAAEGGTAWARVGEAWLALGQLARDPQVAFRAEGCLEVALELDPTNLDALELEAKLLLGQHRFAAALERAEAVLAKDKARQGALELACDALIELGRYDEAAVKADAIGALKPGPGVHARAAFFSYLHGDSEQAKIWMRSALAIGRNPRQPQAAAWGFAEAAKLFWHEGDYTGAEAVYREALKWAPSHPAATIGLGRALLSQRRYDDAVAALEKVEGSLEAAWLLGDALTAKGDAARANAAYARVEALGADDPLSLALFLAVKNRDAQRAVQLAKKAAKSRGGIWMDEALAWALFRAGEVSEAATVAARAVALGTKDARLMYHVGAIQIAAGDPNGRALVARALALNPEFDLTEAADARQLLAQ